MEISYAILVNLFPALLGVELAPTLEKGGNRKSRHTMGIHCQDDQHLDHPGNTSQKVLN